MDVRTGFPKPCVGVRVGSGVLHDGALRRLGAPYIMPGAEVWADAVLWELELGISASGLYTRAKNVGEG